MREICRDICTIWYLPYFPLRSYFQKCFSDFCRDAQDHLRRYFFFFRLRPHNSAADSPPASAHRSTPPPCPVQVIPFQHSAPMAISMEQKTPADSSPPASGPNAHRRAVRVPPMAVDTRHRAAVAQKVFVSPRMPRINSAAKIMCPSRYSASEMTAPRKGCVHSG